MRRLICLVILLGLGVGLETHAFERISSGSDAYAAGDYPLASRLWEDDAKVLRKSAATPFDKKVAALGYVLSSMSAARAGDRRAYQVWGEAQSILAELGTGWDTQVLEFRNRVNSLGNPGSAQVEFEEGAVVSLSANDIELQRLATTGVFDYKKPPQGLIGGVDPVTSPQAVAQQENDIAQPTAQRRILANRSPGISADYAAQEFGTGQNDAATEAVAGADGTASTVQSAELKVATQNDEKTEDAPSVLLFRRVGSTDRSTTTTAVVAANDTSASTEITSAGPRRTASSTVVEPVLINRGGGPIGQRLGTDELLWARVAWRYFEEAEQSVSGLADSHPGHARVSVWDIGSHIAALVSAHQLEIITDLAFSQRIELLLSALEEMPLYDDALPNRNYTSDTVELLDASGVATPLGSGWSAVDLGRLLIWLKILGDYYPVYGELLGSLVAGWDLSRAVDSNSLVGAFHRREGVELFREGRFGFEHYAAQGYLLWGAMASAPGFENTQVLKVGDRQMSVDSRPRSATNGYALMLMQTELGCSAEPLCETLATTLQVQKDASNRRGRPVAVSDYHLDKAPWFGTTNLAINGSDWTSMNVEGARLPDTQMSLFTTKAAFMSDVLSGEGTALMSNAAGDLQTAHGFWESRYTDGSINRTLSLATNAAVLEALWYRRNGRAFLSEASGRLAGETRETLPIRRF